MACQGGPISNYAPISNSAIMAYVNATHYENIAANLRHTSTLYSSALNDGAFPKN
eukprot:CAMPEP_0113956154 /NCGR_PEP_ID=MMETSP0011_2-20120614/1872_1 /TAXON_ID=101924 /ORGANISM="Rhodosorus marinus" /LENGTH=54 /DNA_ID=CAMNT_0000966205 /DNA_START=543 /DNA_END=707 /DNA_ORIENTATION=+ /assembly_acc=CAM_ASM_000156